MVYKFEYMDKVFEVLSSSTAEYHIVCEGCYFYDSGGHKAWKNCPTLEDDSLVCTAFTPSIIFKEVE